MKKKTNPQLKPLILLGNVLILFLVNVLLLVSCKKDGDPDIQLGMSFPVPDYEKPSDADAVLVAVKASVPYAIEMPISVPGMPSTSEVQMEYGMGIALFKGNTQASSVKLNNTDLKFTNGVHLWQPDFSDLTNPSGITGIDLSGGISWNVTGPNITKTLSSLPNMPKVSSAKTVVKADGYTLTNTAGAGAQKTLYGIYSTDGKYVLKEKSGASTSITFTKEELAGLGSTKNGIVQANAYTITSETVEGKKVYYIRQSSYSLTNVEIK